MRPSGDQAIEHTPLVCALRVWVQAPLDGFHNRIVLSQLPDARAYPSGDQAIDHTQWLWPERMWAQSPLAGSHNRIVWSSLAEARQRLSGDQAIDQTVLLCPERDWVHKRRSGTTDSCPARLRSSKATSGIPAGSGILLGRTCSSACACSGDAKRAHFQIACGSPARSST